MLEEYPDFPDYLDSDFFSCEASEREDDPLSFETELPFSDQEGNGGALVEALPHKEPEEILKKYWGYPSFREKQRDIIDSVLKGRDTLGLLPTGGGKSITFQVPGLMLRGTALVITPLIALMEDQVQGLKRLGIKASAIHSGIPSYKIKEILNHAVFGNLKFLYLSPERIASEGFVSTLRYLKVSMIVVDECHCISQWGYDFRPDYLNIISLRKFFPQVPILALTATATPLVKADILRELKLRDPCIIEKSFVRENLSYIVRPCNDKAAMVMKILHGVGGSSIVYCRNRALTGEIAQTLRDCGFTADNYHAGLSHAERDLKQKAWMEDETRVIVATNAFGMGIDKPDVRTVIHWSMPSSLEEYYQEAGRAGRDGLPSYAVALVGPYDKSTLSRRIKEQFPPLSFIRGLYDLLMSYLQIGEGDGFEKRVRLDLEAFIETFKLPSIQTEAAIRILEMAGVFSFRENSNQASRVMIILPREALYGMYAVKGNREAVLEYMLRKYSGIFTQFTYIEEEAIAIATQIPLEEIYETLMDLVRLHVIHYIPRSSLPLLTLTTKREPGRILNIPPEVYHLRKERFAKRINAVRDYLFGKDVVCREQHLLSYFGETDSKPCGRCDLCRSRKAR